MQAIELPVISGFGLQRKARIERKAAEARLNYSAPAIELVDQPVEKSRLAGLAYIAVVTLINLNAVFWVYPLVDQLAEWVGVSALYSTCLGLLGMVVSIPVVIAITALVCRRSAVE